MAFRVGQDVVCLRQYNRTLNFNYSGPLPAKGGVYTVRGIDYCEIWKTGVLYLEEFLLPKNLLGNEFGFDVKDFRPLTQQNIEIVESLKAPPPADLDLEPLRPEEVAFQ
jgi:hypothetical protein